MASFIGRSVPNGSCRSGRVGAGRHGSFRRASRRRGLGGCAGSATATRRGGVGARSSGVVGDGGASAFDGSWHGSGGRCRLRRRAAVGLTSVPVATSASPTSGPPVDRHRASSTSADVELQSPSGCLAAPPRRRRITAPSGRDRLPVPASAAAAPAPATAFAEAPSGAAGRGGDFRRTASALWAAGRTCGVGATRLFLPRRRARSGESRLRCRARAAR